MGRATAMSTTIHKHGRKCPACPRRCEIESISSLATPIERHGRATESSSARRRNPRWALTGVQVADCANATEQEAVAILRRSSLIAEGLASRGDGNDLLRVRSLTRTQPRGKPRPWPRDAFGSVLPQ